MVPTYWVSVRSVISLAYCCLLIKLLQGIERPESPVWVPIVRWQLILPWGLYYPQLINFQVPLPSTVGYRHQNSALISFSGICARVWIHNLLHTIQVLCHWAINLTLQYMNFEGHTRWTWFYLCDSPHVWFYDVLIRIVHGYLDTKNYTYIISYSNTVSTLLITVFFLSHFVIYFNTQGNMINTRGLLTLQPFYWWSEYFS